MSNLTKFSIIMQVNDFESKIAQVKCINHSFNSCERMQWKAQIRSENESDTISIFLFLKKIKSTCQQVRAITRFSLLKKDGNEFGTLQTSQVKYKAGGPGWGELGLITKKQLSEAKDELLPGGVLTIVCDIDAQVILTESQPKNFYLLNNLYVDRKFSDVTIDASGTELKAHKAILAARSPVFDRMFSNDMKEAHLNRVEVAEFQGDVLEAMLKFIYTNVSPFDEKLDSEISDIDAERKLAMELYKAADKYHIDDLKVNCEEMICRSLEVEAVLEILFLADQYNAPKLRDLTLGYICLNSKEVTKLNEWSCFVREKPDLAIDVVRNIVSYMSGPDSRRIQRDSI